LLESGKKLVWFYDYFGFLKPNEVLSKIKIILTREKKLTSNSLDSNLAKINEYNQNLFKTDIFTNQQSWNFSSP
jgi:hypothetical protein